MKALSIDKGLSVIDIPVPARRKGDALIRVTMAGICNTDHEILKGYVPGFTGIPGHEFLGYVEEADDGRLAGRRVTAEINCACGTCDFCRQGLQRHCPHRTVLGIHNRSGAFAEFLQSCGFLAKGIDVSEVTATVLDRPRHDDLVSEIRETGSRIRLIGDGDVAAAIATAWPDSGVDVLFGVGGTPEGVIAAAALKCMGGELIGRLWPRDDAERSATEELGYDLNRVLGTDDLVAGDNCFFAATGITDGNLLHGVHYQRTGVTTQSLVMRSRSGTVRLIEARHHPDKLEV